MLRFIFALLAAMFRVALRRLFHGPRLPGWSFRYEVIAELLRRDGIGIHSRSAEQVRAGMLKSRIHPTIAPQVRHERVNLAGHRTELFTPSGWTDADATLLYLHGGGYVVCSPGTHRDIVSRIAVAGSVRTFAIEYRKAPEHAFPAAIEDCFAAYRELLESGVSPEKLFVAGDSAGGGLTLATLLRVKDAGLPLPRAAVLLSPWVDLECTGESIRTNHGIDYLNADGLEWAIGHYLQGGDRRHPHVTFVHADVTGLPPLLVQSGGAELFLSEHERFVEHARASGVEVLHEIEPHMVHVWHGFASFVPECGRAIERIGAFIRERVTLKADEHAQAASRRRTPSNPRMKSAPNTLAGV